MTTVATSGLVALAAGAVQSDDYLVILDVHDTTQAASGSLKKILWSSILQTATTAVTVSTPLTFTQQWNDAAVTFTGIKANVTSTASAAASLLLDLQVGGTSQWKVTKAGAVTQLGALAITGALSGATTGAFSAGVTMTTLGATTGTFSGAVSMTALTATTGAFSSTLTVTGVAALNSTASVVAIGDGVASLVVAGNITLDTSASSITAAMILGADFRSTSSQSGAQRYGMQAVAQQTAANSGGITAISANPWCSHTSGTVVACQGLQANISITGSGGTTSGARCITGGVIVTAGTVTEATNLHVSGHSVSGGGVITTAYGIKGNAVSQGTTNWAIYFASSTTSGGVTFRDTALATTATVGFVHIPSCAGTPTGVPSPIPTGQIPWIYDSTAHKVWFYSGSWRGVVVA